MRGDGGQSQEVDLDRTDRLPILEGAVFDPDVEDDAVRIDYAASASGIRQSFARPSAGNLPSLTDSVRCFEEKIARQNSAYEVLTRSHEQARSAEAAAVSRANTLGAELGSLRATLVEIEARSHATKNELAEKSGAAERHQKEAAALRDTLVLREATLVQVLHTLGERDSQLAALQREHAQIVPVLDERFKTSAQLDADLRAAQARADALSVELAQAQTSMVAMTQRFKGAETQLELARSELSAMSLQAGAYLENLRTREWRSGFDQNLFRELDVNVDVAQQDAGASQSERDELRRRVVELETQLAAGDRSLAESKPVDAANETRAVDVLRLQESLSSAEKSRAELSSQVQQLQADAQTREDEMTVLVAHLREARRPVESGGADFKRLTDELRAKTLALDKLADENGSLKVILERTRGTLEEREFFIRRLGHSESKANVPGNIQPNTKRVGISGVATPGVATPGVATPGVATPGVATPSIALAESVARLARIDGQHAISQPLGRRTRIGRAPGCELQIDSTSVSRHHALVLVGPRDVIIEDLNSTNGVVVNGRKVSRHLLNDGDLITIGEAQFRLDLQPSEQPAEPSEPHVR